jgi:hypothetical protein
MTVTVALSAPAPSSRRPQPGLFPSQADRES